MKQLHVYIAALLCLCSCSQRHYYIKGLERAQNPTPESVYSGLTVISPANKDLVWDTINGSVYVLAVSWKADTTYYTKKYDPAIGCYSYNTGQYPIFVTAAPYLKQMHLGSFSDKKLTLRLDQLLGLPPVAHYSYFLEIWVKPEDLVRPCFDPSIDVNVCEYSPSAKDNSRMEYSYWLYQYVYNSFSDTGMMNRYPFTHMGYTYDWSPKNKSHVGLSEFVIGGNKNIYIRKVYTTRGYFE